VVTSYAYGVRSRDAEMHSVRKVPANRPLLPVGRVGVILCSLTSTLADPRNGFASHISPPEAAYYDPCQEPSDAAHLPREATYVPASAVAVEAAHLTHTSPTDISASHHLTISLYQKIKAPNAIPIVEPRHTKRRCSSRGLTWVAHTANSRWSLRLRAP
jgi:hypothetical protein